MSVQTQRVGGGTTPNTFVDSAIEGEGWRGVSTTRRPLYIQWKNW